MNVEVDSLADGKSDARVHVGSEARMLDADFIGSHGKLAGTISALLVGLHGPSLVGRGIAQFDLRPRHHGAARIGDRTFERTTDARGLSGCRRAA